MSCQLVQLADAVLSTLNVAAAAAQFSATFVAIRTYKPKISLQNSAALKVTVIPRKEDVLLLNRDGRRQVDYLIDVGVQMKLNAPESNTEGDALMALVEEIKDFFFSSPVTGREELLIEADTDATGEAGWVLGEMDQKHMFASYFTLTFRGFRP